MENFNFIKISILVFIIFFILVYIQTTNTNKIKNMKTILYNRKSIDQVIDKNLGEVPLKKNFILNFRVYIENNPTFNLDGNNSIIYPQTDIIKFGEDGDTYWFKVTYNPEKNTLDTFFSEKFMSSIRIYNQKWYNVVISYTDNTLTVYIDGLLKSQQQILVLDNQPNSVFVIGSENKNGAYGLIEKIYFL